MENFNLLAFLQSEQWEIAKYFVAFICLKGITQTFLDKRQIRYVWRHKEQVPEKFEGQVPAEDHLKAANYTIEKIKTNQNFRMLNVIFLLAWTLGGGLQLIDHWVRGLGQGEIVTGLLFFVAFALISTILALPESIYSTFKVEAKYGFNKTTPKLFVLDLLKSLLLSGIIGLPVLALLIWLVLELGDKWWLWGWAAVTLFQFFLLWIYPVVIAPLFNKFQPLEEGETKEKVLALLDKTGFTSKGLFVMDASTRSAHGNAYFTGFGKNKRIVFFDTLLRNLSPGEVEAVLAHELGHFKKKHVLKGLIKSTLMALIGFYILGVLYKTPEFYIGHGASVPSAHMALVLFMLVTPVYTFLLTPISAFLSRKYEFEADAFAATYSDARDLINALVKLYKDNASTLTPDPLYSQFYHSHPPALIRVEHLEKLERA